MHLLKRTLIHQKRFSTTKWINNLNVTIPKKNHVMEISIPPRQLLGIIWYNLPLRENRIIQNLIVKDNDLRFHQFLMHVNLDFFRKPGVSKRFVNTTLEKLKNLELNSNNSVMKYCFISSINPATEETMQEKKMMVPAMTWCYHIKRTVCFQRSANCLKCQL